MSDSLVIALVSQFAATILAIAALIVALRNGRTCHAKPGKDQFRNTGPNDPPLGSESSRNQAPGHQAGQTSRPPDSPPLSSPPP